MLSHKVCRRGCAVTQSLSSEPLLNFHSMEFAEDVWSQEAGCDRKAATARKGKDLEPVPLKQQRCRKMRIRSFQRESEREMRKWMGAHRKTYNAAVALVRQEAS